MSGSRRMRRRAQAATVVAVLSLVGCLSGGDKDPLDQLTNPDPDPLGPVQVTLTSNNSFSPSQVTVEPRQVVVFVNEIIRNHTVTPDGHTAFSRRDMAIADQTFEVVLTESGTYQYYCEPHRDQGMTGVIIVR